MQITKDKSTLSKVKGYILFAALIWTAIVLFSLVWNISKIRTDTLETARIEARMALEKDIMYRRWAAGHGGVYAPVTDETPPNPHLNVPERDIPTPSGRLLTLINPSYMTRQVNEQTLERYGIFGSLTSSDPVRPENKPDAWEKKALAALDGGQPEFSGIELVNGLEYMRLMRPLAVEKSCLNCHESRQYRLGGLQGGISVAIPMPELRKLERGHIARMNLWHTGLWMIGVLLHALAGMRIVRNEADIVRTKEALAKRTHDLGERVKELNCLYGISQLISVPGATIEKVMQGVAELIPPSWQYPEISCARVTVWESEFATSNFTESAWVQSAEILANGNPAGKVEVFYLEERRDIDEGPFMREERDLIDAIAGQLGQFIEQQQANDRLRETSEFNSSIIHNSPIGICVYDESGQCVSANKSIANIIGAEVEQVLDQNYHAISSWEKTGLLEKALAAIKEKRPARSDLTTQSTFGKDVYLDCHMIPFGEGKLLFVCNDISDRMAAENALKKSEEIFNSLFQSKIAGIVFADTSGNITKANGTFLKMVGYEENDLPLRWDEMTPEEWRDIDMGNAERVMLGEDIPAWEKEYYRKDGSRVPILIGATTLKESAGETVCFVLDITERKKAEEETALFKTIFDNANFGAAIVDPGGFLAYINNYFANSHGYDPEELLGKNLSIFHTAEQMADVSEINREAMKTGGYSALEVWHKRRNGTVFPMLMNGIIIYDKKSDPKYIAATAIDITELKRGEEQLRRERDRAQKYLDIVGVIVVVLNADRTVGLINRKGCQLLGYEESEILGKDWFGTFLPEHERERTENAFTEIIEGNVKPVEYFENAVFTRNHEERLIAWNNTVLWNDEGRITGTLSSGEDVTERRRARAALRKAKQAAEAANRAKSEFLSSMSHELRTPLNGILGYTQILKSDPELSKDQKVAVGIIHRSGEHLLWMINDVLDLSTVEAGKMILQPADFNLMPFLTDIFGMIGMKSREKNIDLVIKTDPDLSETVAGDKKRLRQILLNLLQNAVKYTDTGQIVFEVAKTGKDRILFRVADTGVGIPEDKLGEIFLPFHRVTDKRLDVEGTGMGLAIARNLVRLMGGELGVKSELGKGSEFSFELDLPEAGPREGIDEQPGKITGYRGKRIRVLIVDDIAFNRGVLKGMLAPLGFHVTEAQNGHEALAALEKSGADLVLMDLVMPKMDGYETIRQIRGNTDYGAAVVLAISADATIPVKDKCLAAGFNAYVAKPVAIGDLLEKIGKFLNLEWIWEDGSLAADTSGEITPPGEDELEALHALASIGDISGLTDRVGEMIASNPQLDAFGNRLLAMAKNFETKKIKMFLSEFQGP